jgi:hypothetical protein
MILGFFSVIGSVGLLIILSTKKRVEFFREIQVSFYMILFFFAVIGSVGLLVILSSKKHVEFFREIQVSTIFITIDPAHSFNCTSYLPSLLNSIFIYSFRP